MNRTFPQRPAVRESRFPSGEIRKQLRSVLRFLRDILLELVSPPLTSRTVCPGRTTRLRELVSSPFAVFVAQLDYWEGLGGTERYQLEDMHRCNESGINVFQIYPRRHRYWSWFRTRDRRVFGINFNGTSFGRNIPMKRLEGVLRTFNRSGQGLAYNIHHLLYWKEKDLDCLFRKTRGKRVFAYLHDMYFCCPSIHFLRDPETYCGALEDDFSGEVCDTCGYGVLLPQTRRIYAQLFRQASRVITPSPVVTRALRRYYPEVPSEKIFFCEHQTITAAGEKTLSSHGKLRVAYLGVQVAHKGWSTFEKLASEEALRERYDFFHIGNGVPEKGSDVRCVEYSTKTQGFDAGIQVLLRNEIELVLLLSTVPEAYSYTLHEACAAGIPVLTYRNSGNIARKIREGLVYGRVFDTEEDLFRFLRNLEAVAGFLRKNRNPFLSTVRMQSAFLQLTGETLPHGKVERERRLPSPVPRTPSEPPRVSSLGRHSAKMK